MAGQTGHAEVRELHAIVVGDKNVGGLDVAMNDGAAMSDGERDGDVGGPFTGRGESNAALGNNLFQSLTFDQFHNEKRRLRGFFDAHVVDGDDGRMREFTDDAGFAEKASARFPAGELRREKFDSDKAVNERIVSADDTAMGASAESFENLVATDLHLWRSPQSAGRDGAMGARIKGERL